MQKLVKYIKPFTSSILLITAFMLGMAIAELMLPLLLADMVNNGMMLGDTEYVLRRGTVMLFVALISSGCSIVGVFLAARTALGIGRNIRNEIFERVSSYSLDEFDQIGTASLITRTTNDVTQVQNTLVMIFRFMIFSPIMCIGGIIMARFVDTGLSLILLAVLPVMLVFILIMAKWIMPMFSKMQGYVDRINLVLRENLMGVRVIRAFNRQKYEEERFDFANRDLTEIAIPINKIMACMHPVMILLMNVTALLIIWFGGIRISQEHIQLGDMIAFLQYAMQIMFSIVMVTMIFATIPRAQVSAVRINEVLSLQKTILDNGTTETANTNGTVEFRDVTYRYQDAEQPVLKGISFTAQPGELTAIIGSTGAGKSTLVNLIARFYDAESGQVLVDGVDIREQPMFHVRQKLSVVPQTANLFSGTVIDNIRYGKEDASQEEVEHAAKVAQADSFIVDMENGYDSEVSQGGTNLSGGQKQRISIARALIRKTEIYIFDDSFSALDFKTDAALRASLKTEIGQQTQIIVAQRVSTIMEADKIIVLNEGEIAGIGTHKELLATCDVYGEIARSQLSEEELANER